ncbi:MAG: chemotaxis protein CheX [Acidobacteriota bacterium]
MSQAVTAGPSALAEVVESVFKTMLHIDVSESFAIPPPSGEMVTAAVFLTGAYQGAVLLHCPPWQARGLTAQFLNRTTPGTVDDDVLDVMGELTNMIAGNLKSALIPGTHLSIPAVTQGADSAVRLCGTRPVSRSAFETPLGPVWVTMFTHAAK